MPELAVVTSAAPAVRSHTGYRLVIEASGKRIRAVFNGEVVAESERALVMHETGYAPTAYIPRADVRMDLLQRTGHHTHCPFKGDASYWTIEVGGQRAENAAWSYEDPFEEAEIVRDHIAFYWDQVDMVRGRRAGRGSAGRRRPAPSPIPCSSGWDGMPGARRRRRI